MENNSVNISASEFEKLVRDVALIKQILIQNRELKQNIMDDEGELTDEARERLSVARATSTRFSHEEVKKKLFSK